MPTDIGVHDLTSNTSHSPFVVSATSSYFANPPYGAFDSAAGNSFWIGQNGGIDILTLDRGNAATGTDFTPHDLTGPTSHSPISVDESTSFGGFPGWKTLSGTDAYWIGTNAGVDWVRYDFGSGNSFLIKSYWIRVNDVPEPNRAPKNWTFEGSPDGSTWTTLHTVTNQTGWGNNETRYFEPTDISTAYRWFRINISANNGDASFTQMDEVYFFTTAQDRSRSKVCGSYSVQVPNANSRPPMNWTLEGSKHEGGWTALDTQTGQTGWAANETRTFTCAGGGAAYEAFRLNITANNGDGTYTEVEELSLFEGATTVDESITLGLTQGIAFSATVTARDAITLGLSCGITPANNIGARNAITLSLTCGITPATQIAAQAAIALGLTQDMALANNANQTVGITIGLGGLDLAFRRFQDAELTIGLGLGMSAIDQQAGATPGTFRPDGPSGPAGIFRAIDNGDARPGRFRSPGGSGATPGTFRPKK